MALSPGSGGGQTIPPTIIDNELTAPLELPAEPGKPLTTQTGTVLDDGGGNATIGGIMRVNYIADESGNGPPDMVYGLVITRAGAHINPYFSTPALSTNPPVSGTVYQNTTGGPIQIALPVTGGTAADTAQWALGSTDTPGDWGGADTVAASEVKTLHLTVPNDWYWSITTGATIGTADVLGS